MKKMFYDIKTVIYREFLIEKKELMTIFFAIIQPLVWFVLLGYGIGSMIGGNSIGEYLNYILPGVIGITAMNSGLYGGASLLNDIRFGYIERYIISPIIKDSIIIGKSLFICAQACIQMMMIIIFSLFFGIRYPNIFSIIEIIVIGMVLTLIMVLVSLSLSLKFKTHNGLYSFIGFISVPMMLLSNAFYNYDTLPNLYKIAISFNPLTHCLDLMRGVIGLNFTSGFKWYINLSILFIFVFTIFIYIKIKLKVFLKTY